MAARNVSEWIEETEMDLSMSLSLLRDEIEELERTPTDEQMKEVEESLRDVVAAQRRLRVLRDLKKVGYDGSGW